MGNHLFVIFAVLDVSFAVNSCLNRSFLYLLYLSAKRRYLTSTDAKKPIDGWGSGLCRV